MADGMDDVLTLGDVLVVSGYCPECGHVGRDVGVWERDVRAHLVNVRVPVPVKRPIGEVRRGYWCHACGHHPMLVATEPVRE